VQKVITLSPMPYHAFKNDYPKDAYLLRFSITPRSWACRPRKYPPFPTLLQCESLSTIPVTSDGTTRNTRLPAKVLKSISGLQLLEMGRVKENAFLLRRGGGNFFTDLLGKRPGEPGRGRVREAIDTGAFRSCPSPAQTAPRCWRMRRRPRTWKEKIAVKRNFRNHSGTA